MTTTSEIIKSAFRESNLIAISRDPTDDEYQEGLDRLNALLASVMDFELGEQLKDWQVQGGPSDGVTDFWTSVEWTKLTPNVRVLANLSSAETLYLPPNPYDGARVQVIDIGSTFDTYSLTLNPNGRMIEGLTTSLVLTTLNLDATWLYRADKGSWERLTDLSLDLAAETPVDTEFPFPRKFDDMFIIMLAIRLNPRHRRVMDPLSIAAFERSRSQFRAAYRQRKVTRADKGVLNLSHGGRH